MRFLITERRRGKTTALVEWVKQGKQIPFYPGWSRVLLVGDMRRADQLRGGDPKDPSHPTGLEYQQVFYIDEFLKARSIAPEVEVAIDDADDVLRHLVRRDVTLISATGSLPRDVEEIDRCARAYGWEIGRGNKPEGPFDGVVCSPDNPFMHANWRDRL